MSSSSHPDLPDWGGMLSSGGGSGHGRCSPNWAPHPTPGLHLHGWRSVPRHSSYPHSQLSPGGLSLAIEGPSKAEISCTDNQDGTCSVSYLPVLPGDYSILVKYNEQHIPGSPFTARVTGRGRPAAVTKEAAGGGTVSLPVPGHTVTDPCQVTTPCACPT